MKCMDLLCSVAWLFATSLILFKKRAYISKIKDSHTSARNKIQKNNTSVKKAEVSSEMKKTHVTLHVIALTCNCILLMKYLKTSNVRMGGKCVYLGIRITPQFCQVFVASFVPLIKKNMYIWVSMVRINVLPGLLYLLQMIPLLLSFFCSLEMLCCICLFTWFFLMVSSCVALFMSFLVKKVNN